MAQTVFASVSDGAVGGLVVIGLIVAVVVWAVKRSNEQRPVGRILVPLPLPAPKPAGGGGAGAWVVLGVILLVILGCSGSSSEKKPKKTLATPPAQPTVPVLKADDFWSK